MAGVFFINIFSGGGVKLVKSLAKVKRMYSVLNFLSGSLKIYAFSKLQLRFSELKPQFEEVLPKYFL